MTSETDFHQGARRGLTALSNVLIHAPPLPLQHISLMTFTFLCCSLSYLRLFLSTFFPTFPSKTWAGLRKSDRHVWQTDETAFYGGFFSSLLQRSPVYNYSFCEDFGGYVFSICLSLFSFSCFFFFPRVLGVSFRTTTWRLLGSRLPSNKHAVRFLGCIISS